jgi:hypothetical protein
MLGESHFQVLSQISDSPAINNFYITALLGVCLQQLVPMSAFVAHIYHKHIMFQICSINFGTSNLPSNWPNANAV